MRSQEFVLPQVHSLDDVSAVVEDPTDVFRVHRTCKMGVTVVTAVSAFCTDPLRKDKVKTRDYIPFSFFVVKFKIGL